MRKRGVSSAYSELHQALAETGRFISATRLERWAYWRTGGLIDRPQRHGAGRGTRSEFSDLALARDHAAAVADTLRPRMSLDAAALLLHRNGHPLLDQDVRAAVLAELKTAEKRFRRNARVGSTSDQHAQAWNAAWAAYRAFARGDRARRRWRAQAELPDPAFWAAAGQVLLGDGLPARGPQSLETLQAFIASIPVVQPLAGPDLLPQLAALAEYLSFPRLLATVASRPAAEIAQILRLVAPSTSIAARSRQLAAHDELSLGVGVALGYLLRLTGAEESKEHASLSLPSR